MIDIKLEEFDLSNQRQKLEKLSKFLKKKDRQEKKAKLPPKLKPISNKMEDFYLSLSDSKHAILKYSKSYRDYVLSLNINSTKSFIITKQMWSILRKHINFIDQELSKPRNAVIKQQKSKSKN